MTKTCILSVQLRIVLFFSRPVSQLVRKGERKGAKGWKLHPFYLHHWNFTPFRCTIFLRMTNCRHYQGHFISLLLCTQHSPVKNALVSTAFLTRKHSACSIKETNANKNRDGCWVMKYTQKGVKILSAKESNSASSIKASIFFCFLQVFIPLRPRRNSGSWEWLDCSETWKRSLGEFRTMCMYSSSR